jgi:copper chaperone CopZ
MSKVYFRVEKQFCGECSSALRRFLGGLDGVTSVSVENGMVAVDFDEERTRGVDIGQVAKDSIERLGYRLGDA